MLETQAQIWKGSGFSIERRAGAAISTVVFKMSGPFTARDMYGSLTPDALKALFEIPAGATSGKQIFDLSSVPYMDSAGLGMMVTQLVRCQNNGVCMTAVGVTPRVLELFRITKVDGLIPMAATVEEAEAN